MNKKVIYGLLAVAFGLVAGLVFLLMGYLKQTTPMEKLETAREGLQVITLEVEQIQQELSGKLEQQAKQLEQVNLLKKQIKDELNLY